MLGIPASARVPDTGQLVADVASSLDHGVSNILSEKLPKMAKVQNYDKKVLLIWKSIPLVGPEQVAAAFASKATDGLDGIFFFEYGADKVTLVANAGLLPC